MREFLRFAIQPNGQTSYQGVDRLGENVDCGFTHVLPYCRERIYLHRAERVHSGRCPMGSSPKLLPNCSNLPEVLNLLQSNPTDFRDFNDLVRYVLPQIRWVSVAPSSQELEITRLESGTEAQAARSCSSAFRLWNRHDRGSIHSLRCYVSPLGSNHPYR